MQEPISIETIASGAIIEAVNKALDEIGKDVADRPHHKKAREVTVKIKITPQFEGAVPLPTIDFAVTTKIPGHVGITTHATIDPEGRLHVYGGDPADAQGDLFTPPESKKGPEQVEAQ